MPAQPWVPGPVPIFLAPPTLGSSPLFFGISERGVALHNIPTFDPYLTDYLGRVPTDYSYQGKESVVEAAFTRWDEALFAIIADQAGLGTDPAGIDAPGAVGTLMGFENRAYPLWTVFPYSAKAAYSTMPGGYHFFGAFLDDEGLPERGAKPAILRLRWKCIRRLVFPGQPGSSSGQGLPLGNMPSGALYDKDMTGVNLGLLS